MLTILAGIIAAIYLLDRAWKTLAIARFFRRALPPEPQRWPTLSLIQPLTASPNDVRTALTRRAQNPYPGKLEHILVCDAKDATLQALCHEVMSQFPHWEPKMVLTQAEGGIALKPVKQLAGLDHATGEVICFIDDDILLRPETLSTLVRHLQPGVGATFGLACYVNWRTVWGGLMSAFVNANALLTYIPWTFLTDPYTITGHIYALRRAHLDSIGGLTGMDQRLDDDHELARRVMRAGLRNCQTSALYDVDNELPTMPAFLAQMKRWFVFPREMLMPGASIRQKILTMMTSLPNLLPGLSLLVALIDPPGWQALGICLLTLYAIHVWNERIYLKRSTPAWGWALLLPVALLLPFQILLLLCSDSTIHWRGQKLHVKRGGEYEIVR